MKEFNSGSIVTLVFIYYSVYIGNDFINKNKINLENLNCIYPDWIIIFFLRMYEISSLDLSLLFFYMNYKYFILKINIMIEYKKKNVHK